jgi:hypothetical protein
MRAVLLASCVVVAACSGSTRSGFDGSSSGSPGDGGPTSDPGPLGPGTTSPDGGGPTTSTSIIYANTDDSLYSLDPTTNAVTLIGTFGGANGNVTDCAVNAAGEVYVNTTDTIYKATLPAGGTGKVSLSKIATIGAGKSAPKFYALAFAPAGVLGSGEGLVGGDGNGVLWSIDPVTGDTKELGSFGQNGSNATFALSGDVVFYVDGAGKPTGLATIRSCKGTSCSSTNDYLAGIDMNALVTAFTSGTPAGSLLSGIYGGSASSTGPGTQHGELFGLGAWQGKIFGFERASANNGVPALVSIDAKSGAGTILPSSVSFSNGWSGACVTTKVTVTVPPPPR